MTPSPETVLSTWFPTDTTLAQRLWWGKDPQIDADLRTNFAPTLVEARAGALDGWARAARGRLALIIVLDQLSRNIHRGSGEAFAGDADARRLVHEGLALGHDQELAAIERVFFYMPLEHSELLADQDRCVELFRALAAEAGESFAYYVDFAERHRAIVARFGRFPHRNEVLGRASSEEELTFLREPGSSF